MKKVIIFMNLCLALLIVGCGGGGGDSTVAPAEPVVLSSWTRLFGNGDTTISSAVAVDPDGNSYATGDTSGKLDPDRTGTPNTDAFIVKYDKDGAQKWVKQIGLDASRTYGRGVAVDTRGNSYVTGQTNANLVAGSGSSTGLKDLFVAKYNSSGTRLWVKQLGVGTCHTVGFGIAIDSQGNSYVTGYTNADLDEGGSGVLTGSYDFFVVKYDTSGNRQWIQQRGAAGAGTFAAGIAVDTAGYCFVTGRTQGDLDGAGAGTLTGSMDVFVAKYTTSGNFEKVIQMGVAGKDTYGYGIAADSTGNHYVTGVTYGDLDGAGSGTLVGSADVFVIKFNSSVEMQWLKQTSAAGSWAEGKAIALDSEGNCYAAGNTNADLDGDGPGVFTGAVNIFVIAYDKDGTSLWSRQMGSDIDSDDMSANGIAVSTGGTCLVAGYVDEAFDGEILQGLWSDAFVTTKLNE